MDPVTGSLLGIGLNQLGNQLQLGQQQGMMQQQFHNQMALNSQMQGIAQANWDYTNYENQVKHMKNAGLNVGLMYGMGGGGGQSSAASSGGSAAMGQAPQAQNYMGLMQAELLGSQAKLNEAEADKAKAQADKTRGVDTENTQADTALKNVNTQLQSIAQRVETSKEPYRLDEYLAQVNKLQSEARTSLVEANVNEATQKTQIDTLNQKLVQIGLENILIKANTNLTNERVKQVSQDIINSIRETNATVRNSLTNEKNQWNNEAETKLRKELGNRGIDVQEQGQIIDLFKTVFTGGAIMAKPGTTTYAF